MRISDWSSDVCSSDLDCFHTLRYFFASCFRWSFGLFLLFLLLFVFRCLLTRLQRLFDIFGRFIGLALRINSSLRFMGFAWFYSFLVLIWKFKIVFSIFFLESDITLIGLSFFILQSINVVGLSGDWKIT